MLMRHLPAESCQVTGPLMRFESIPGYFRIDLTIVHWRFRHAEIKSVAFPSGRPWWPSSDNDKSGGLRPQLRAGS
jgi:hypothetical protein